jgi:hypothetical protein
VAHFERWAKNMKNRALLILLPFLSGCWAVNDVATNRDFDRSIPFGAQVQSGAITARTPVVHLIDEEKKDRISLRSVDIGIIAPERYTAFRTNLSGFTASLEAEKKTASDFRSYVAVIQEAPQTVYLMRFDQRNTVKLIYVTYLGSGDDGTAVSYTSYFFDTAFKGQRWWDKPPDFFLRFAESVEIKKEPNQTLQPTAAADLER